MAIDPQIIKYPDSEDFSYVDEDLIPKADDTYDLGSSTYRFADVWATMVAINNTAGDYLLDVYDSGAGSERVVAHFQNNGGTSAGTAVAMVFGNSTTANATSSKISSVRTNSPTNTDAQLDFYTTKSGSLTLMMEIDPNGYLDFNGYIQQDGIFGEIYVTGGSTAQSIATGGTPTKLTGFASDGNSSNITNDVANDKCTFTKTGKYLVTYSISGSSGTNGVTFTFEPHLNAVAQTPLRATQKYTTAGDIHNISGSGIIDVTTATWDLDLRAKHDNGGAINFTPVEMNMNIYYLGET